MSAGSLQTRTGERVGPDIVCRPRHRPSVLEVKRSGWVCAWSGDRDPCEQLDDPALACSRKPVNPLSGWFATDRRLQLSGDEKQMVWQTEILRNVMRRICLRATTRLSQKRETRLQL